MLTELVRDGAENGLIGRRLHLSYDTVKTHMKRINSRIESANRTHLVLLLMRQDVVVVDLRGRVHEFF